MKSLRQDGMVKGLAVRTITAGEGECQVHVGEGGCAGGRGRSAHRMSRIAPRRHSWTRCSLKQTGSSVAAWIAERLRESLIREPINGSPNTCSEPANDTADFAVDLVSMRCGILGQVEKITEITENVLRKYGIGADSCTGSPDLRQVA